MASFFTTTLLVSIAALVCLMVLKQIELSTGTVILSSVRPKVNRFFKTCLVIVERVIPALTREGITALWRRVRSGVSYIAAHGLLRFEAWLKRMLMLIRQMTHPSYTRGEASPFLKEVGEYKKQLETEAKEEANGQEKAL